MRFPIDVILVCIRWYVAYPLSYRHLEEIMQERGVSVDHSSINRWAVRFLPLIEKVSRKHKRLAGASWRMDETYIKIKGVWKYLYRAVDRQGKTVDFLLTAKRDMATAKRFFKASAQLYDRAPLQPSAAFAIVRLPDEMVSKIKKLGPLKQAVTKKKKLTVTAQSLIILPLRC